MLMPVEKKLVCCEDCKHNSIKWLFPLDGYTVAYSSRLAVSKKNLIGYQQISLSRRKYHAVTDVCGKPSSTHRLL